MIYTTHNAHACTKCTLITNKWIGRATEQECQISCDWIHSTINQTTQAKQCLLGYPKTISLQSRHNNIQLWTVKIYSRHDTQWAPSTAARTNRIRNMRRIPGKSLAAHSFRIHIFVPVWHALPFMVVPLGWATFRVEHKLTSMLLVNIYWHTIR